MPRPRKYSNEELRERANKRSREKWKNNSEYREASREANRKWREENKDKIKEYKIKQKPPMSPEEREHRRKIAYQQRLANKRERYKERREKGTWVRSNTYIHNVFNDPVKRLLYYTKTNARGRGLEHNLTTEDINIPSHCPYTGLELFFSPQRASPNSPSVDRINNEMGYIKGNIQVISWLANSMKRDATEEQLVAFAKGVLRIHDRASSNQVSS